MSRASAINQARVHTGFHYPRSITTAIRSLANFPRFVYEFKKAIVDDFTMLYAIARYGSKVNAQRFQRMFAEIHAPIQEANAAQKALFLPSMIESVFATREYAFDYSIIRQILEDRMVKMSVEMCLSTEALCCTKEGDVSKLLLSYDNDKQTSISAKTVFNCTYSRINCFLQTSSESIIALKHEITEMVLVEPPSILGNLAVTVMDGPFFSCMPFPSRKLYSLSHVRYTPHGSWQDEMPCHDPHRVLQKYTRKSHFSHMAHDIRRFMPDLKLIPVASLFEIKTVLKKNETDDGRPIFYMKHPSLGEVYTVMGSKIDNVYDLFEGLRNISREGSDGKNRWRAMLGMRNEQ